MTRKFRLSYLIPLAFLLAGCEVIGFSDVDRDEGLEDGDIEEEVIEYYDGYGDSFDPEDYDSFTFTFDDSVSEQGSDFTEENQDEILDYLSGEPEGAFCSIEEAKYVALGVGGLKIGSSNSLVNGVLDMNISSPVNISYIEIYAKPRSARIGSQTGSYDSIDSPVSVAVNDSKYVRIDTDFEAIEDIEETTCSYEIDEEIDHLKIEVHGKRAILTQIVVYTSTE